MTPDAQLDLEMAYAIQPHMDARCMDPHSTLVECGRERGHQPPHAAGYGAGRIRWDDQPRCDDGRTCACNPKED